MLIPVVYQNGTHDLVKDFYLDYLINNKKIEQFKRGSGWVPLNSAKIRGKGEKCYYLGPERRQALLQEAEESDTIEFYPAKDYNLH